LVSIEIGKYDHSAHAMKLRVVHVMPSVSVHVHGMARNRTQSVCFYVHVSLHDNLR